MADVHKNRNAKNTAKVEGLLRDPHALHLYPETRLAAPEDGHGHVWRSEGGVRGFVWIGRGQNLVFAGQEQDFLAALAVLARRHEDRWVMAVGPRSRPTPELSLPTSLDSHLNPPYPYARA